jgi:hypothetical protein
LFFSAQNKSTLVLSLIQLGILKKDKIFDSDYRYNTSPASLPEANQKKKRQDALDEVRKYIIV